MYTTSSSADVLYGTSSRAKRIPANKLDSD